MLPKQQPHNLTSTCFLVGYKPYDFEKVKQPYMPKSGGLKPSLAQRIVRPNLIFYTALNDFTSSYSYTAHLGTAGLCSSYPQISSK